MKLARTLSSVAVAALVGLAACTGGGGAGKPGHDVSTDPAPEVAVDANLSDGTSDLVLGVCQQARIDFLDYAASHRACTSDDECAVVAVRDEGDCGCYWFAGSSEGDALQSTAASASEALATLSSGACEGLLFMTCDALPRAVCASGACANGLAAMKSAVLRRSGRLPRHQEVSD